MPIREFPDPRRATPEGLLAFGGDLHPDSLILAYRSGIFPWPIEGYPLPWFCPPERAILDFSSLHISRSLRRARNQTTLRFSIDTAFSRVIEACARTPRSSEHGEDGEEGEEAGTWITSEIEEAYTRLHEMGIAHSAEAWNGERLVGGIYGVSVAGTFSAESMFRLEDNASKLALLHLVSHLRERGLGWMDVQVMSPHMKAMGAKPIPRDEFLALLRRTQKLEIKTF